MTPDEYLTHLRADAALLLDAAAAAGLDAKVPTCPDWDVRALLGHVGAVYNHKIECMRLGRRPDDSAEVAPPDVDPFAWVSTKLDELIGELVSRGPDAPSYTWSPPDQTVGFWYRRMAQETAVHRVDAEAAAGRTSTIDDALALDGIDERVCVMLGAPWWAEYPVPEATGRTFAIRSGDALWRATLEPQAVPISREEGPAVGEVSGTPYDVLMWVWGRPSGATTTGDVTELADRLAMDD